MPAGSVLELGSTEVRVLMKRASMELGGYGEDRILEGGRTQEPPVGETRAFAELRTAKYRITQKRVGGRLFGFGSCAFLAGREPGVVAESDPLELGVTVEGGSH